MESYIEDKECKEERQLEHKALRSLLGHILLETKLGNSANDDIAYYSRKLREVQEQIKRQ